MASKLLKKTSSGTSPVVFYKKTSTGQVRCPVYRKTSTGIERLDQQLVTKTYTVTGYPDWLYTYIGDGASDTSLYKKSTDPLYPRQGAYSGMCYYSPISFKSTLAKVKGKNITKVELWLGCLHSYYSSGLSTYISGTTTTATSVPSSTTTSIFNNKRYSSNTAFTKGTNKYITLNNTAIADIKSGAITGFRPVSPSGWGLTDYGYFEGSGTNRPYVKITYTEEVWE